MVKDMFERGRHVRAITRVDVDRHMTMPQEGNYARLSSLAKDKMKKEKKTTDKKRLHRRTPLYRPEDQRFFDELPPHWRGINQ